MAEILSGERAAARGCAIWDDRERLLRLYRDRAGVKPLYYRSDAGGVLFGSELKALVALNPGAPFQIDRRSVGAYLQYGYIPTPQSIYQGIHKLPPGCRLTPAIAQSAPGKSGGVDSSQQTRLTGSGKFNRCASIDVLDLFF